MVGRDVFCKTFCSSGFLSSSLMLYFLAPPNQSSYPYLTMPGHSTSLLIFLERVIAFHDSAPLAPLSWFHKQGEAEHSDVTIQSSSRDRRVPRHPTPAFNAVPKLWILPKSRSDTKATLFSSLMPSEYIECQGEFCLRYLEYIDLPWIRVSGSRSVWSWDCGFA